MAECLQQWLKQLPADIMHSRPILCITCTSVVVVAPYSMLHIWIDAAEASADSLAHTTAGVCRYLTSTSLSLKARQHQEDLLGEVIIHACLSCKAIQEDGPGSAFAF